MTSLQEYQTQLVDCVRYGNLIIQDVAAKTTDYTNLLNSGQLTKDEYNELLADLQRTLSIDNSMSALDTKEKLHTIITGLLEIASLLA